jgi:ribosomal protein S18 acetylase RimI-like enzyme
MRDALAAEPPEAGGPEAPRSGAAGTRDQPEAPPVHYRRMTEADLPFAVGQHLHHFPAGFFARLGRRFLTEYYRSFLTGSSACTFLVEVDGTPTAYLVGVADPPRHRDHVVREHGRALVLRAIAAMLLRPRLGFHFVRTRLRLYARKLLRRKPVPTATPVPSGASHEVTAVLTHVAVVPDAQARGIGTELIRRFQDEVRAAGCTRITLVTASGDDGAGPYYRRQGWEALGERTTPDGMRLTTYQRDVPGRAEESRPRRNESA